ncbi:MAG: biosynthetic-type acetolactate synthase large subunit [Prevotella sp.]|nr:biosynthetic-type acetolactate synthase large subunit [Prevotella sp.]MCI6404605.1 biosynthetic-type acetolactate synthase large subunit [Prevotella sp.]MCI6448422.1 biosynthetic-type acetolactate synthase large subunit [Prevotella sp.]MCI7497242.1 biosynthetic-type acetolactate synthase large subunit [Prevotella sp.]MDD6536905.1 biosynthetic-type acetolactate synthase large subunit [Prevotella sp.]
MEKISGAEALMKSLEHEGVNVLFGYPGGAIIPTYDALYDHKNTLHHILVRHEQAAVHAAQGYARVSGKVGCCIVTSGPGAMNTISGVADAMVDSTPLVVICGQVGASLLGTDAFQEVDVVGVTQPISKWNYQIRRAEDIPWAVARAFYIAKSGRPGPVVLDFTKNAQTATFDYKPQVVDFIRSYKPLHMPKQADIDLAAKMINEAVKPFMLVGHGVELGGAQKEFLELCEKAQIPFGQTMLGLSTASSDHPLNMGMLGMHGNLGPNVMTNQCDLLIAVGMRFDDRITGNLDTYAKQAKIIHFDIDPSEFNKNVKVDLALLGDCKSTLALVSEKVTPAKHQSWIAGFKPYEDMEFNKVIEGALYPKDGPLLMGEVVRKVSEAANNEAILVTDVGQNQLFACRYFKFKKYHSCITSGGCGTMGFGIPAAMGACYAAPDRTVCMFAGDGGFQMTMQELGTIMENQIPVKMIMLNNNFLGNVRQWQYMFFDKRYSFTPMVNPDYEKIAAGYNIPCRTVVSRDEIDEAIREMLDTKGPYFLQVAVKEDDNVLPMTPPGGNVDEMLFDVD